jgi:hypothetical protein
MIRIIIGISAVLNAVLLMVLFGPLQFFLYLSIIVLVASLFYIRHLLALRKDVHSEIDYLIDRLSVYTQSLEQIYELEMFYGDETIEGMIEESKKLINDFCEFEDKFVERQYEEEDGQSEEDEKKEN